MRIAFNGQRLAGQRFGVGRYVEYLLRYWSEMLGQDEEMSLFLRRPVDGDLGDLGPRVKPVVLDSKMSGIPWENLALRGAASRHDVLFCPAYSAPVFYNGPLVVATHSVNETEPAAHSWLYSQTYSRLYRHCARIADAVIVPGAMTRDAVLAHYGVPEERIHIVHQGADEAFQPVSNPEILAATRREFFGGDRPYILFVGKCSQRRNIPMLIKAFAMLRAKGFPHGLLLFGPDKGDSPLRDLIEKLNLENDVVQTDGVIERHSDLAPIYAAADVFVHPSENEGWSMTTVEAMACGVAVIAANHGGLGEVASGHALMLDHPSADNLLEALVEVLSHDALRADLKHRARERGKALRWDAISRQTLDIVRSVGAMRRRKSQ